MNLALSGVPVFKALDGDPGPQHKATMHICPSVEYIERAWGRREVGKPSRSPLIEMTMPTMYDPSLAPPGHHIMGIFLQYAPYTAARYILGTGTRTLHRTYSRRNRGLLPKYPFYCRRASDAFSWDLNSGFGITGGNIFHGEMSLDQMFVSGPLAGWARYRTP